jgi:GT2 family glycosyltransferase
MTVTPEVVVVVPAYNAARFLRSTLPALQRADRDTPVVVVDAGSTDDTAAVAVALGAHVIRLPQREGPARARNAGVAETAEDVILFIDADCVAHPDVIDRVREAFRGEPHLVGLTGSYDANAPERNFFSEYMNLRHHFFHQRARRANATFWAGCGAVRRAAFLEVGGFDAERFPSPQIEDIELGVRLRRIGRTRLDPDLEVTHLKRWNLRSVVETDIRRRAIPWTRLILETGEMPDDLNLGWSQRIASLLAPFALAAPGAAIWGVCTTRWEIAAVAATLLVASLVLHADMLRCCAGARGWGFALRAWLFHQVHLVYSSLTMALCILQHLVRGLRS